MKRPLSSLLASTALATVMLAAPFAARAEEPAKPAEPPKPAPAVFSPEWMGGISFGAQIQAGVSFNPDSPRTGLNFGQFFTDRSNQVELNQLLLTVGRTIDPKTTGFDMGFKVQFMYGSDARFTHFLGVFDQATSSRNQVDFTEANITMRLPVAGIEGIDLKAGLYPTPLGYETIDPSTNPFYSHSYIFNFGLPFKHTGLYAITHLTDVVDLHLGVDTGINTTFGNRRGDNNSAAAFLGGFGLNLMEGKLTLLALTHIGPENSTRQFGSIANDRNTYSNDVLLTFKPTDKLTLVTEFNFIRNDLFRASAGGVAQYVGYAINDNWTLNARGEIFRDDKNFFVTGFRNNLGPVQALGGYNFTAPFPISAPGVGTTYGAITLGATWKPEMPKPIGGLMIRPELRIDQALSNNKPFANRSTAVTLAADFVINF